MAMRDVKDRPGAVDITIGVLSLVLQLVIVQIAPLTVGWASLTMLTRCIDASCVNNPSWGVYALLTALIGGYLLLFVTGFIVIRRMVKSRRTMSVAITGVVLQVFLVVFALMLSGLAQY